MSSGSASPRFPGAVLGDPVQTAEHFEARGYRAPLMLETIARMCRGVRPHSGDDYDGDFARECATRFLMRWPELAEAPDVAHLPLLTATRSWGVPVLDVPAMLGGTFVVDLELERLAAGDKAAMLKEGIASSDAVGLARAYRALGLAATVVETHGVDATGGKHLDGGALAIVAVARTAEDLEATVARQRARDVRGMGALMGYPSCCVEAFLAQADRRDNAENERWTIRRSEAAVVDARISRLGWARLISHHLCRVDCAASIEIAERSIRRVAQRSELDAAKVRATLARSILFLDHSRAAAIEGRWRGEQLELESIRLIRWEGAAPPFEGARTLELAADHVVLRGEHGERRTLPADRPLILIPGEVIAPAVRRNAQLPPTRRREMERAQPERPSGSRPAEGAPEHAPEWVELRPDFRSNLRELGWSTGRSEEEPALPSRDLAAAIVRGRERGLTRLRVAGGEPMLRADLLPLVRHARAHGYARIRLHTNGTMLAGSGAIARLRDAGVTELSIAVHGPDASTHDRLTGTPGSFALTSRGIDHALASGLGVECEVIAYRSTTARLAETMDGMISRGVTTLRLRSLIPHPEDREAVAEEPSFAEVGRALLAWLAGKTTSLVAPDLPPCVTGEEGRSSWATGAERAWVVEPRGRAGAERVEPTFPSKCSGCAWRRWCAGVPVGYLERHGDGELSPRSFR